MNPIVSLIPYLVIPLLVCVVITDLAARLIRNEVCLMIAVLGVANRLIAGPLPLVESLVVATTLFLVLLAVHHRGWMGGGDVKLLVALAIGLPMMGVVQLLTTTALAGGLLAMVHLMMRNLPYPNIAPVGSSLMRRVYAVERWRNLRQAPLPYGVAIAFGGIWVSLGHGV